MEVPDLGVPTAPCPTAEPVPTRGAGDNIVPWTQLWDCIRIPVPTEDCSAFP